MKLKQSLKNKKTATLLLGILLIAVFGQALWIAKLYSEKKDKTYEVNLVKINTEKDSIDYLKVKENLTLIDQTVQQLNAFLLAKNITNERIEKLDEKDLSNSVYVAEQTNRYSEYLVSLQNKLRQIPLGTPASGSISSNFGIRRNPIPSKTPQMLLASVNPVKTTVVKDSLGNLIKKEEPAAKNNTPAEPEQQQFHKGIDFAVPFGSDVKSAASGTVIFSGKKGGYGNCVIISHGNGLATLYGHLSELIVKANDEVASGQVIAKSGNSGRSTGPHLHYEVHKNNQPVNPKLFLSL
ncbi:MAG: M23 family metallopeptidase [Bergeyella sp.]